MHDISFIVHRGRCEAALSSKRIPRSLLNLYKPREFKAIRLFCPGSVAVVRITQVLARYLYIAVRGACDELTQLFVPQRLAALTQPVANGHQCQLNFSAADLRVSTAAFSNTTTFQRVSHKMAASIITNMT